MAEFFHQVSILIGHIALIGLCCVVGHVLYGIGEFFSQAAKLKAAQAEHQRLHTRQSFGGL